MRCCSLAVAGSLTLLVALCAREALLFEDPSFWLTFRQAVVPTLRTYPSILLWQPACARAEDSRTF